MMLTLAEIAELVGGRLTGDPGRTVARVATLASAAADSITFVTKDSYLAAFLGSDAACAFLPEGLDAPGRNVIHHLNPYAAMAQLIGRMYPDEPPTPGVSPLAVVHPAAVLGDDVSVGPFAVVGAGAVIGDRTRIDSHCVVAAGTRLGPDCRLFPGVTIYPRVTAGAQLVVHSGAVIGSDGFGFTRADQGHMKIPQVGGVRIGDHVEIGANSAIDGGMLDPTVIGNHVKIDNLVQVGHNVRIGDRSILCGQVGIAGSAVLEEDVILTGQVGVTSQVRVGKGTIVASKSAVHRSVESGRRVAGIPAFDLAGFRRSSVAFERLPEMREELRSLRRRLAELEGRLGDDGGAPPD